MFSVTKAIELIPLRRALLSIVVICFVVVSVFSVHASEQPRIQTDKGAVAGKLSEDGAIREFLGIPYAQPPVGPLRWRPPQPATHWNATFQATEFGKRCIQSGAYYDILFRDAGESEDCLTLNVWAPAKRAGQKLPVMVWFYGGGFNMGGTSEARQDGTNLARKGVIVVSMNFRLGIFGFYAHSELSAESKHHASGNYGLLDQIAALEWVRRNISAFGGDPKSVTIFGESAGSSAVSCHMISPLSKGLFVRAIGESGSAFKRKGLAYPRLTVAEKEDEEFAKDAFGNASLAKLRSLPVETLLKAALRKDPVAPRFQPVIDGYFFPEEPAAIFASHQQSDVPMLVGWNRDEGTNQVVNSPEKLTVAGLQATAKADFGSAAAEFTKVYAAADDQQATRAAEDYASDKFIAFATWAWLEAQAQSGHAPIYRYYFAMDQPGDPLHSKSIGTFHSDDIEYVFGNLDSRKGATWRPADYKLSEEMQTYWTNFAKTGDPNSPGLPHWPMYKAQTNWQVMHLDDTPTAEPDAHRDRFLFLNSVWGN